MLRALWVTNGVAGIGKEGRGGLPRREGVWMVGGAIGQDCTARRVTQAESGAASPCAPGQRARGRAGRRRSFLFGGS